jgi:hypothetical protein
MRPGRQKPEDQGVIRGNGHDRGIGDRIRCLELKCEMLCRSWDKYVPGKPFSGSPQSRHGLGKQPPFTPPYFAVVLIPLRFDSFQNPLEKVRRLLASLILTKRVEVDDPCVSVGLR